jgi:hypothetical protein
MFHQTFLRSVICMYVLSKNNWVNPFMHLMESTVTCFVKISFNKNTYILKFQVVSTYVIFAAAKQTTTVP